MKKKPNKLVYKKPKITVKEINFHLLYDYGFFNMEDPILLAGTDCKCGAPLCASCSSPDCC